MQAEYLINYLKTDILSSIFCWIKKIGKSENLAVCIYKKKMTLKHFKKCQVNEISLKTKLGSNHLLKVSYDYQYIEENLRQKILEPISNSVIISCYYCKHKEDIKIQ